jgi:hypothetical protein
MEDVIPMLIEELRKQKKLVMEVRK